MNFDENFTNAVSASEVSTCVLFVGFGIARFVKLLSFTNKSINTHRIHILTNFLNILFAGEGGRGQVT